MKKLSIIAAIVAVVVLSAMLLTACAPASDPDTAEAALEKNGYTTMQTTGYVSGVLSALAGKENNITGSVSGTKTVEDADGNKKTEYITIIYYKTAAAAKEAYEAGQDDSDKDKKEKGSDDSDWVYARSGKMIYWGTKAAVKAAR